MSTLEPVVSTISAVPLASNGWRQVWTIRLHPMLIAFGCALFITLMFNKSFFQHLQLAIPEQPLLYWSLCTILFLLNFVLLLLLTFPKTFKFALFLLLSIAALSSYFVDQFGILIDSAMLQNALETDQAEMHSLLSSRFILQIVLFMLLPIVLLSKIQLCWPSTKQLFKQWLLILVLSLSTLLGIAASQRAELAPFLRNFREIKHLALPLASISAAVSLSNQQVALHFPQPFVQVGLDAKQFTATSSAGSGKPRLIVMVLGETARSDHFALNGYARQTNPALSAMQSSGTTLYSFQNVASCGTATALSVPCMFSNLGREHYAETVAKHSDNVLDVLQRAGIAVSWYDNNSGCKGVCDRVPSTMLFEQVDPNFCDDEHCFDAILTDRVRQQLQRPLQAQDQLIVLHQLGSHGPEYSKRSEQKHKLFTPECTDKQLSNCQQTDLINAYDNSIVATDELLANLIQLLQQQPQYRTALLYLADHGESLGENGVYLHGLPYWMAPKAQTQVPMIWWMSDAYQQAAAVGTRCLNQQQQAALTHDYLFHSLLAMYQVQTSVYQAGLDFLAPCRPATAT